MPLKRRRIAILGATGSIGQQALQVIAEHAQRFEAVLLGASRSIDQLQADVRRFSPAAVLVEAPAPRKTLSARLKDSPTKVYAPRCYPSCYTASK